MNFMMSKDFITAVVSICKFITFRPLIFTSTQSQQYHEHNCKASSQFFALVNVKEIYLHQGGCALSGLNLCCVSTLQDHFFQI